MPDLVLDGLKDPMKETKTWETKLKQPQNGVKLSPKPITPRSKRHKTKEKHRRGRHLQI
jgi:hypothetical protein